MFYLMKDTFDWISIIMRLKSKAHPKFKQKGLDPSCITDAEFGFSNRMFLL